MLSLRTPELVNSKKDSALFLAYMFYLLLIENNFHQFLGRCRGFRCPHPGSIQGQAGWGYEQPDLEGGVRAYKQEVGTR